MQQNPNPKIKITAYPRIHVTLISMTKNGYRINGGAGFTLGGPCLVVEAEESETLAVIDTRKFGLSVLECERLIQVVRRCKTENRLAKNIKITISGDIGTHFGFGSGTSIRLASIEALCTFNSHICSRNDLIRYSLRGGTSGVGIHSYFDGGLIVDVGRKNNTTATFAPSSLGELENIPRALLMQRLEMPEWPIGICIPQTLSPLSEQDEVAFFQRTCPIPIEEVYATAHDVFMGILPAIIEHDKAIFCDAINNIQNRQWKKSERALYGQKLLAIEGCLRGHGARAVGMSSLGPTLFFLGDNLQRVVKEASAVLHDCLLFCTHIRNKGRELEL